MTSPLVLVAEPKVQPEVPAVVSAASAARAEAPLQHKEATGPLDFGLAGMEPARLVSCRHTAIIALGAGTRWPSASFSTPEDPMRRGR